mmetsp:Transcript_92000/g.237374  ORF Transcript_92000/g.237374 Transcript_92000/m.237374 type:complete len:209 (+) Transcript_92000:413-1039(+)
MLPCAPVAKASSTAAFSSAKGGHASRRSMTFCTTRQTFPSPVKSALAIMPRTCASSGNPCGSKSRGRAAAAASRNAEGSSRRRQAASSTAKSSAVATESRTRPMSSGMSSSICSMEATCTSRSADARSVGCQFSVRPHSAAVSSTSTARRARSALSAEAGQPSGMKTLTRDGAAPCAGAPPAVALQGDATCASSLAASRHSVESAETT